jgi:hypothetical protein
MRGSLSFPAVCYPAATPLLSCCNTVVTLLQVPEHKLPRMVKYLSERLTLRQDNQHLRPAGTYSGMSSLVSAVRCLLSPDACLLSGVSRLPSSVCDVSSFSPLCTVKIVKLCVNARIAHAKISCT